jgi:hypothetical protein
MPTNQYLIPMHHTQSPKGIWDRFADKQLEFYIAGYTRKQPAHQALYEYITQTREGQSWEPESIFPIAVDKVKVTLQPEPDNKVDINAVKVIATYNHPNLKGVSVQLDLGYVPMEISRAITQQLSRITDVAIFKAKRDFLGKYYTHKIVLGYDGTVFSPSGKVSTFDRFASIGE